MNRILVADDHAVLRTGLKLFLGSIIPFPIIDEAWNGDSVVEQVKQHDYQLIILDVNMPETDSFELVRKVISINSDAKILIFSMNSEDMYAKRYLQLGAMGYITKSAASNELAEAINTVFTKRKYISPRLKEQLIKGVVENSEPANPFEKLSAREFAIMLLLIKGESSAAICNALHLKPSTIATFKLRIFKKLNCKNIIDMQRLATIYNITPA